MAVHFNGTAVGFDDGFCQRKAQADPLSVFGKAAAIKSFENMGQVLRVDAASVVLYDDLEHRREGAPGDAYKITRLHMVESVFYDVADCFGHPTAVAQKGNVIAFG